MMLCHEGAAWRGQEVLKCHFSAESPSQGHTHTLGESGDKRARLKSDATRGQEEVRPHASGTNSHTDVQKNACARTHIRRRVNNKKFPANLCKPVLAKKQNQFLKT